MTESARRSGPSDLHDDVETPVSFGALLRHHRIAAGLTQEALADRAGLAIRGIQDLERDRHRPHRQTVNRLVRALSLSGDRQAAFEEVSAPSPRQGGTVATIRLVPSDDQRSGGLARTNFHQPLTSFVGRADDLAVIQSFLRNSRLITLTGAGGCGKTRLALRAASEIATDFSGGVTLVELAPLVDPNDVPQAIGVALGLPDRPGLSKAQSLVEYLRGRHHLLVLDNCEHVIDACSRIVASLLIACSRLTVLATSRQPLRTSGEVVWRVPSLAAPVLNCRFLADVDLTALALDYPAIRLFLDRAQAVHPGFDLTRRNVLAVAEICSRLDGIPLAIELAAALVGDLSVGLISERLNSSFALLTRGDRAALPRQQTLQATIDWTYDLLSKPECLLFQRLAVFAGGFTLDAAEGICAGNGLDPTNVLPHLTRLLDKSLIVAEEVTDGTTRYHLLETLRQFGRAKLEQSGEADLVRRRHRDWFLVLAESVEPDLWGPGATTADRILETEHNNLRVALELCRQSDALVGLRLAASLWWFWVRRDHFVEGSGWLNGMLELAPPGAPARATALLGAGVLARDHGNLPTATTLLEESLRLFRNAGEMGGIAHALTYLGLQSQDKGDFGQARVLFEESLAVGRGLENDPRVGFTVGYLGDLDLLEGDFAGARMRYEEMLGLARRDGNPLGIAVALSGLGLLAKSAGDYPTALAILSDALGLRREIGQRRGIAFALSSLGDLAVAETNYTVARTLLEEALAIYRDVGARESADALASLGDLARLMGEHARAAAHLRESITFLRSSGDVPGLYRSVRLFGLVALAQGAPLRALRLFAASTAHAPLGTPLEPVERTGGDSGIAAARAAVTEEAFTQAWSEGQRMTLEQATTYAVGSGG